jgi:hypothetical protein
MVAILERHIGDLEMPRRLFTFFGRFAAIHGVFQQPRWSQSTGRGR